MIIKIKGKNEILKDLEEAKKHIEEASAILYRAPTKVKIVLEECEERKGIDARSLEKI